MLSVIYRIYKSFALVQFRFCRLPANTLYISLSLNGNKVRAHEDGDYTGLLQAQMYLLTMMKKCIIFFLGFGKFCMRVKKM